MRIFATGAAGWIGSAVVPELISAGHKVLGLARSDASAKAVADMGAEVLRGDLNDIDVLRAGALDSDGVIHLAFVVPSVTEAATRTDARAIETFATSLAGSGKPMVISGGTIVTPGRPSTERDELIAQGPIAARITNMQAALAATERDVRAALVMLPRSVHGQGERHGFVPQLIAMARTKGVSGYIGDGASRCTRPCSCTCSAPTCPPPAPSPRSSWAGSPPTPASSRTSNRATTSSDQPRTAGETTTRPYERAANPSHPAGANERKANQGMSKGWLAGRELRRGADAGVRSVTWQGLR